MNGSDKVPNLWLDVPFTTVLSPTSFNPSPELGTFRFRYTHDSRHLDALLINKGSKTLVVSLHGAVNRQEQSLPRFERWRTLSSLDSSSMYLSYPGLWADPTLELTWFTGWSGLNIQYVVAQWIVEAATKIGATNIVITGTSGGGFAALQISALIPNSVVVAFNPQTSIENYRTETAGYLAQMKYQQSLWPEKYTHLSEVTSPKDKQWTADEDDRFSCLKRYENGSSNNVLLVQNDEDKYYEDHYLPFINQLKLDANKHKFRSIIYSAGTEHNPPMLDLFKFAINAGTDWAKATDVSNSVQESTGRHMGWHERLSRRIWGLEEGVPWSFESKLFLDEFCISNKYPKPKTHSIVALAKELASVDNYQSIAVKPVNLSSSIGVMVLNRNSDGSYHDEMSGRNFSIDELIEHQETISKKWKIEAFALEQRLYDIGKYSIPRDFKFYAFNGQIALIQCIDRNESPSRVTWYDGEFENIVDDSIICNPKYVKRAGYAKPSLWKQLTQLAQEVSSNIGTPFARIDLFATPHGPMLGEVTLTPGGPYFRQHYSFSNELDKKLGELWSSAEKCLSNNK